MLVSIPVRYNLNIRRSIDGCRIAGFNSSKVQFEREQSTSSKIKIVSFNSSKVQFER